MTEVARRYYRDVAKLGEAVPSTSPRILVIATIVYPPLVAHLAAPMAVMALLVYLPSLGLWTRRGAPGDGNSIRLENPLELKSALRFGAFLAVVMLAGKFLTYTFGEQGIFWLAAISGVADLNAITLSVARMSQGELAVSTAPWRSSWPPRQTGWSRPRSRPSLAQPPWVSGSGCRWCWPRQPGSASPGGRPLPGERRM